MPIDPDAGMVSGVLTAGIQVRDQDRALDFHVGVLGMEKRRDVPIPGGGRWITVAAGPAGTTPALVVAHDGVPAGVETGIRPA